MTPEQINKILAGYAATDMRRARRERAKSEHGSLLVTQTKQGLVDLSYDPAARRYRIASSDGGGYQFAGTAGETRAELIDNIYSVGVTQ